MRREEEILKGWEGRQWNTCDMIAEAGIIWGEEQNQPERHREHGCRQGEGQKLEGSVMAFMHEMS